MGQCRVCKHGLLSQATRAQVPLLTGCVALGRLLNVSEPLYYHWQNRVKKTQTCIIYVELCLTHKPSKEKAHKV